MTENMNIQTTSPENQITKKELNQLFWRSHLSQISHNYERMQSLSSLYTLSPILDKLYEGKPIEEKKTAYRRHLLFYKSYPMLNLQFIGLQRPWRKVQTKMKRIRQ